ncbi:MAG: (d)CMP kinase [Alphaproteobacteria bacterium]
MIVTIDGHSGSGKGTAGRAVAKELGFKFLDTGLLFRAVGFKMLKLGLPFDDEGIATGVAEGLAPEDMEAPELRQEEVGIAASKIGLLPKVRFALLNYMREFAQQDPGAVLDGRDIGTVVCPGADVKFFFDSRVEVRAERRFKELVERGEDVQFDTVLEEMRARDHRDSTRKIGPTIPAKDAIIIDTSDMTINAVVSEVLCYIERYQADRQG